MERILPGIVFLSDWLILSSSLLHQYHFVNLPLTWTDAQTYCRKEYTDMVTIQNSEELDQLKDTLSSARYSSEAWIGLYSVIKWKWSDGSSTKYRNWDILGDEPNFIAASQFCVSYSFGAWWDDYCENKYTVVCSNGTQLEPEYVYVTEEMDWSRARGYCRENFIELAAVRNDVENKMLKMLVPSGICATIGFIV